MGRGGVATRRAEGSGYDGGTVTSAPIGRASELGVVQDFLGAVEAGARVLLLDGASGMGKTTIWQAGVAAARDQDRTVLVAQPTEVESSFAYAGLGDLLSTIDDNDLGALPAPQRRAMMVALLREDSEQSATDQGAVAVALLNLLATLAKDRPVILAVDDVQWLDEPSKQVLHFAMRRLAAKEIGFLLALRTGSLGGGDPMDWLDTELPADRIEVEPLEPVDLGEVLESAGHALSSRIELERIHQQSGGNPLFAVELARAMDAASPARDDAEVPAGSESMTTVIDARIRQLPRHTREVLEFASAAQLPTVEIMEAAVGEPIEERIEPALDAQVVAVEGGVLRFTHPLRAMAVRNSMSDRRRREVHGRLADVAPDEETRARHVALTVDGPDEAAASLLASVAERAWQRGASWSAVELSVLAHQLTPPEDAVARCGRALREAYFHSFAGDARRAFEIGEQELAHAPTRELRDLALATRDTNLMFIDVRQAVVTLRQSLMEVEDDAMDVHLEAMLTSALDVLGEDVDEAIAQGEAELATAERIGSDGHIACVLQGLASNWQRRTGQPQPDLTERALALEQAARDDVRVPMAGWPSWWHARTLCWTDEIATAVVRWRAQWHEHMEVSNERSHSNAARVILGELALYECLAGDWHRALDDAESLVGLYFGSGSCFRAYAMAIRALALAHLGDADGARRDASEASIVGEPSGMLSAVRVAAWALGLLELSLGEPARAHEQLGPLVERRRSAGVREPGELRFVTDDVEALIGMGSLEQAEALLEWYEGLARSSARRFAIAACQRCRGLLLQARGDPQAALEQLRSSRETYATTSDPFGAARTLLALGSAQRQARRRKAARQTLQAAVEAFEALGGKLWVERTKEELGRIGGRAPSQDELTPSERKVAELVARGLTNREVAEELVVTERTVEGHLSNVYSKLGLRSRTELAGTLAREDSQA